MKAIKSACSLLGGVSATAKKLGVKPPTVSEWIEENNPKPVPMMRCMQIEAITNGMVRCEDLNPNINWNAARDWLECRMKFLEKDQS